MKAMRKMSARGDEVIAEYDTTVTTPERLAEIEREFKDLTSKGYFAANIDTKELIRDFNPDANILLMPRMAGGSA